jgi:Cu2+-exporting ATPase
LVEGGGFCCPGCEAAHRLIHEAGLGRYYAERAAPANRPDAAPSGFDRVPVPIDDDGLCTARIVVDGMHCASCVWVTEHVVSALPGVASASVSYASGRATVRFRPDEVNLDRIARQIAAVGYRPRVLGEEQSPDRDLMLRLGGSAFLAANLMGLAAVGYGARAVGMEARYEALFAWTQLALATPIALWGAGPFLSGAAAGLRARVLSMDLPISVGVLVMYAHGLWATFARQEAFLDSMAMLVTLLLAGRMVEARSRRRTLDAATALAASLPRVARRVVGDAVTEVAAADLVVGDRVAVGAGEEVPADGVVERGAGEVVMALLTGESEPAVVGPGSRVVASALLREGAITLRVEAVGADTLAERMGAALRDASDDVTPSAADHLAPVFTGITLVVAVIVAVGWGIVAGPGVALANTVAVLVVACPCALALAQPVAASAGLAAAARRGLLLRSPASLLALADVSVVALDKTGTLTEGVPAVVSGSDAALRVASGLARYSGHPVSRAILREAGRRQIALPDGVGVHETVGQGLEGVVDGQPVRVGKGDAPGRVVVAFDGRDEEIGFEDVPRADGPAAVAALRGLGLRVVVLSGDRPAVADRVGAWVGADEARGDMTPEGKSAWIVGRRALGERVLFVGDGLNDAPALAEADVGVCMAGGVATSLLAASGVTAEGALVPLVSGVRVAHEARRAIRANMARSLVYNVLAVGAAAAGWVDPLVAALLMPASSLMVVWGGTLIESRVAALEQAAKAARGGAS